MSNNVVCVSFFEYSFLNCRVREISHMFPELASDSCGSNTDNGLQQRILEIIEIRTEKLMNEADIDGDDSINILEFNEAIRKFTANENQNNLAQSKPPNGGWGWVIVFSCFIYNLVIGKLHMKMLILVKDCLQQISFLMFSCCRFC